MWSIRGAGSVLLLTLAVLQVIGIAVVLWRGDTGPINLWIVKQSVYVVGFASIGLGLLRAQDATRDHG